MKTDRLALVVLVATGCAARAAAPMDCVREFTRALDRGDFETAYTLTSPGFRTRVSPAAFRAQMASPGQRDNLALMKRVDPTTAAVATVPLTLNLPNPPSVPDAVVGLTLDHGVWRIDKLPDDPYGQATPEAALRSLAAAVRAGRFDVVLRLAPARVRPGLTEAAVRAFWQGAEGKRRLQLLDGALAQHPAVIVEGEAALLPYGDGNEIRFVFEAATWRIDNL